MKVKNSMELVAKPEN